MTYEQFPVYTTVWPTRRRRILEDDIRNTFFWRCLSHRTRCLNVVEADGGTSASPDARGVEVDNNTPLPQYGNGKNLRITAITACMQACVRNGKLALNVFLHLCGIMTDQKTIHACVLLIGYY